MWRTPVIVYNNDGGGSGYAYEVFNLKWALRAKFTDLNFNVYLINAAPLMNANNEQLMYGICM